MTAAVQSVSTVFDNAYVQGSDLLAGWASNGGTSFTRAFEDTRDLIASIENVSGTNLVSRFEYTNNAGGRRVGRRDSGAAFASTWTNAFAYNARSEIAEANMRNGESSYEFDPIGNRTTVALPEEPQPFTYQSNELNQYTSITNGIASAPIHDDDGNMLSGPAGAGHAELGFAWDGENRLIAVTNGSVVVQNSYDSQGRRVRKQVAENGSPVADLRFLYDGWALIRESSATQTNTFVWGLDLSQSLRGAGGVGGLLLVSNPDEAHTPAFDANGNISEYIRVSDGGIASHQEYDAFGRVIASAGTVPCAFGFSTKYEDLETGLLYYGYRFYSPELGRWVNRDPIGENVGPEVDFNLYAFVLNSPADWIDLLGLKTCYRWMLITAYTGQMEQDKRPGAPKVHRLTDNDAATANRRWKPNPDGGKPTVDPKADPNPPYPQGMEVKVHRRTRSGKNVDSRTINDTGSGWAHPRPGLPQGVPPDEWLDLWFPDRRTTVSGFGLFLTHDAPRCAACQGAAAV